VAAADLDGAEDVREGGRAGLGEAQDVEVAQVARRHERAPAPREPHGRHEVNVLRHSAKISRLHSLSAPSNCLIDTKN
jgi:hypothetical protein